jgi:hypothetical protein
MRLHSRWAGKRYRICRARQLHLQLHLMRVLSNPQSQLCLPQTSVGVGAAFRGAVGAAGVAFRGVAAAFHRAAAVLRAVVVVAGAEGVRPKVLRVRLRLSRVAKGGVVLRARPKAQKVRARLSRVAKGGVVLRPKAQRVRAVLSRVAKGKLPAKVDRGQVPRDPACEARRELVPAPEVLVAGQAGWLRDPAAKAKAQAPEVLVAGRAGWLRDPAAKAKAQALGVLVAGRAGWLRDPAAKAKAQALEVLVADQGGGDPAAREPVRAAGGRTTRMWYASTTKPPRSFVGRGGFSWVGDGKHLSPSAL